MESASNGLAIGMLTVVYADEHIRETVFDRMRETASVYVSAGGLYVAL